VGRAFTFWCAACDLDLDDGVDYATCPKCGGEIEHVDRAPREAGPAMPSLARMSRTVLGIAIAVQAVFAVADPYAFPYLRSVLAIAQLLAIPGALAAIAFVPAIRALIDARTRSLHGLEHATIAVLEQRGIPVNAGVTLTGLFDLEIASERGATVEQVRDATHTAIRRVASGEHALVYSVRCGTSYIVGLLVMAVAIAGTGALALAYHVPTGYAFAGTVAAVLAARIASRRLGLLAQRMMTVSPRFASAHVGEVEREVSPNGRIAYFAVHIAVEPIRGSAIAEPV
jgi:hypothetical protein